MLILVVSETVRVAHHFVDLVVDLDIVCRFIYVNPTSRIVLFYYFNLVPFIFFPFPLLYLKPFYKKIIVFSDPARKLLTKINYQSFMFIINTVLA